MNTTPTNPHRQEILSQFKTRNGRIVSPGKFEGEPIFAPHFWDLALDGGADDDDGEQFTFNLTDDDFAAWPELKEWFGASPSRTLYMRETDTGFVQCY